MVVLDLGLFIGIQTLILLPFILSGNVDMVFNVLLNLVDSQPHISANAYNLWFGLIGKEARHRLDSDIFYIFTYKQWGLALFFLMSFIALLPLFMKSLKSTLRRLQPNFNQELVILSFSIIPLIFFFFCT